MSVRVRFAPSPTGFLHVWGARTALYNVLFARAAGGTFVLRIEDTDAARSTEASTEAILEGLRWLGLHWDEGPGVGGAHGPYFQSERGAFYRKVAERLEAEGSAYPCFCTPEELEQRRAASAARGEAPRYDGQCRGLSSEERDARRAAGRPSALRFACPGEGETSWDDVVKGTLSFRNDVLDDFVLMRSDGWPTYNFACVVDDGAMEITHVLRGDDHVSNTPRQILIFQALGWAPPAFAHLPMILGADGTRLSKRHGATSVAAFGDLGYVPEALVNFLALLGWAYDGERELFSLAELQSVFRLERVGSNPSVFNLDKLDWMNGQHLKQLPEAERVRRVVEFLARRGHDLSGRGAEWCSAFVRAIGDRLKRLTDAEEWGRFALTDSVDVDPELAAEGAGRADAGPHLEALAELVNRNTEFTLESLERDVRALAAERSIKPGELIGLARIALTGRKVSVGIFEVMWLLGRERTVERLRRAAAQWTARTAGTKV